MCNYCQNLGYFLFQHLVTLPNRRFFSRRRWWLGSAQFPKIFVIAFHSLTLLLRHFINTTAYHWRAVTSLHFLLHLTAYEGVLCLAWGMSSLWNIIHYLKASSVTRKNPQMSIKVGQKWFHYKKIWFWHLYKNCLRMWEI